MINSLGFLLVNPQLPENIGFCARAIKNFGFKRLDVINPKEKWPNKKALATSVGAKDILKKLGYNKFYEHIPFIKDKLGIKPPVMTPELEDKLCNLFMDIQHPYAKYCPGDRVNFLNYYSIYQFIVNFTFCKVIEIFSFYINIICK